MSEIGVEVMQKKDGDECVTWKEYEALCDHLTGLINRSTDNIDADIQAIQMKVDATETTVSAMQTQVNDLQTSIHQLTTSVNGLRVAIEQRQHEGHGDDDSVHGDNENMMGNNGRGRGLQGPGRPTPLGARRVPLQEDDGLGKPKFTIPRFEGSTDVEDTSRGSSRWRNYGVCMITLKIGRSSLLPQNLMVMLCVGGIALCAHDGKTMSYLFLLGAV